MTLNLEQENLLKDIEVLIMQEFKYFETSLTLETLDSLILTAALKYYLNLFKK